MTPFERRKERRNRFKPNLEISDERLNELYQRIKPVIMGSDKKLHYIKDVDLRKTAFTWSPELLNIAVGIKPFKTIITYHSYGYYGLFKPSIAEVIAQIPQRYLDRCVAFKTYADDLTIRNILLSGYHITITTLYEKYESDEVLNDEIQDLETILKKAVEFGIKSTFSYTFGDELDEYGDRYFEDVYTHEFRNIITDIVHYLTRLEKTNSNIAIQVLQGVLMYRWNITFGLDGIRDLTGFEVMARLILERIEIELNKSLCQIIDKLFIEWRGRIRDFTSKNVISQLGIEQKYQSEVEKILSNHPELIKQTILLCPNNHKGKYLEELTTTEIDDGLECHICGEFYPCEEDNFMRVFNFKK